MDEDDDAIDGDAPGGQGDKVPKEPTKKRFKGEMPTADVFEKIFVSRYQLDEGGQRFLGELIGMANSEARREGYRKAVLEVLDNLIYISSKPNSALTTEDLKYMRRNLSDEKSWRDYLRREDGDEDC